MDQSKVVPFTSDSNSNRATIARNRHRLAPGAVFDSPDTQICITPGDAARVRVNRKSVIVSDFERGLHVFVLAYTARGTYR